MISCSMPSGHQPSSRTGPARPSGIHSAEKSPPALSGSPAPGRSSSHIWPTPYQSPAGATRAGRRTRGRCAGRAVARDGPTAARATLEVVDVARARARAASTTWTSTYSRPAARAHVEPRRLQPAGLRAHEAADQRDVGLQRVLPVGEAVRAVGRVGVDDLELRRARRVDGGVGDVVGGARRRRTTRGQALALGAGGGRRRSRTVRRRPTDESSARVSRWWRRRGRARRRGRRREQSRRGRRAGATAHRRPSALAARSSALDACFGLDQVARGLDAPAAGERRTSSAAERPAVGAAASPSKPGAAPLSAMEPVLSPIARSSATSSAVSGGTAGTAASSARLSSTGRAPSPGSWISVGATHATGACARFHAHASCSVVSPWRSAIGRIRSSRSRPRSIQPCGPERPVVPLRERVAGEHVVVEQPAVVDDARDQLDAVALARRAAPARPATARAG